MIAATAPRAPERLLVIDPARGTFSDATPRELGRFLARGDLLVVNDAATLPASLAGRTASGAAVELRLLGELGPARFRAVLLGAGDWRTRTEHRAAPARVAPGEAIELGRGFQAVVENVDTLSERLVVLRFDRDGARLYRALYERGRPIQYAHVPEPLELWSVQTGYAARPWAVEMPSAGRPLAFEVVLDLRRRGVSFATVTHAAGVSATGDAAVDAALPLPERFFVPAATVAAVEAARAREGCIVAVGTSVVRALEGARWKSGELRAGPGETDLVVSGSTELAVVDALLTGMHEPDASHYRLLQAFAPLELLERAYRHAGEAGYLGHEFGDATLILERS